jgi:hypothetical protein
MAYSIVETKVVNPARRKIMARSRRRRNLTAKQIRFFGTKRQRAALKARRRVKRHAPATKRRNAARRRYSKPRVAPKPHYVKHRRRTNAAPRRHTRRNPGEVISLLLGNPARRKKGTKMARRHYRTARRINAAGRRHYTKRRNRARMMHHRRRNPAGLGRPMDWVKGGVGVLGGVVVTRALPQAVAATYNTGITGYVMNAVTAGLAGWATHALTKDPVLTASVIAGGFAAVIARVISDMTSFGSYLSLTGIGDYQFSNFGQPQHLQAWQNAQFALAPSSLPALTTSLYGSSTDMGGRGGNC